MKIRIAPPNWGWIWVFWIELEKKLCFWRGTRKMPRQFDVRLPNRGRGCADEISCCKRAIKLDDQCNLGGGVRYMANGALIGVGYEIVSVKVGLGSR
jgi:hypothetical protein